VLGQPLHTAAAWTAATALAEQDQWVTELSSQQVDEILAATQNVMETGKPIQVRLTPFGMWCMPPPALQTGGMAVPHLCRLSAVTSLCCSTAKPFCAHPLLLSPHSFPAHLPPQDLTAADFPLPTLGPQLAVIRGSCLYGRGFHLLRGGWVRGCVGG